MRNPFRRTRYLHAIVAGNGNAFLAIRQILVLIGYSGYLIKAKMQPKQKVTARLLSVHDGMANFMKLGCRTLSLSSSLQSPSPTLSCVHRLQGVSNAPLQGFLCPRRTYATITCAYEAALCSIFGLFCVTWSFFSVIFQQ